MRRSNTVLLCTALLLLAVLFAGSARAKTVDIYVEYDYDKSASKPCVTGIRVQPQSNHGPQDQKNVELDQTHHGSDPFEIQWSLKPTKHETPPEAEWTISKVGGDYNICTGPIEFTAGKAPCSPHPKPNSPRSYWEYDVVVKLEYDAGAKSVTCDSPAADPQIIFKGGGMPFLFSPFGLITAGLALLVILFLFGRWRKARRS